MFKHTGDGVLAAFALARPAIEAAIEAQRALELPVRIGVLTGEAEPRGDDYFGPAINRAVRTMAAAHGGQIIVAASTAAIADGVLLDDLGEFRLRDLSQPQRLFQVKAEGLKQRFPPLRTLDSLPGNLPAQATSFLGRDNDLAEVRKLLRDARLVTLTGVGGVGKTRLAVQAAADAAAAYKDGAWLVELAGIADPSAIGRAVAAVLGIAQAQGKTIEESIADALTGRQMLIVLDNCEHLIEACATSGRSAGDPLQGHQHARDQPRGVDDRRRADLAGAVARLSRRRAIASSGTVRRSRPRGRSGSGCRRATLRQSSKFVGGSTAFHSRSNLQRHASAP